MLAPVCITSKHFCTAGLYAHDPYHVRTLSLPCVKLSPTCHAALGRCGEARGEATHLHDLVSSSLVYTVFVSKLAPIRAFCVHVADCVLSYRCIYYVVSFFAACSIAPAELVIKSV